MPRGGEPYGEPPQADNRVIGVVVTPAASKTSPGFPEPELVLETLRRGKEKHPDAVWVVKKGDAYTLSFLAQAGIEPVMLPTLPQKHYTTALKSEIRNLDMRRCDILLVFQKKGASNYFSEAHARGVKFYESIGRDYVAEQTDRGMFIIERGDPPAQKRKRGRKPQGV